MKIGRNIKEIRIEKKMEQRELAEKLHLSNKTISSWECDRTEPNIGMLERIAEALCVTKMDLIEGRKNAPKTVQIVALEEMKAENNNDYSEEEKNIISLYRAGKYKEIVSLMMDKM